MRQDETDACVRAALLRDRSECMWSDFCPNQPMLLSSPTPAARQRKLHGALYLLPIASSFPLGRLLPLDFVEPCPLTLATIIPIAILRVCNNRLLGARFFL